MYHYVKKLMFTVRVSSRAKRPRRADQGGLI
jgi:hypothetical protein